MISEQLKTRFTQLAGLTEIKHNHKNDYGALMVTIEHPKWDDILSMIEKEDLYTEEPGFGLEHKPHATILFGFHKNSDVNKMKELLKKEAEVIEVKLKKISHFEGKEYDVVKIDVESKILHTLNKIMRDNFDYTNDFDEYHPHCTIAYVKKGLGKKYDKSIEELKFTCNKITYSPPGTGKKTYFTL